MNQFYRWAVASMVFTILPTRFISAQSAPVTRTPVTRPVISTVMQRLTDSTIALAVREQLVDSLVVLVLASRADQWPSFKAGTDAIEMLAKLASTKKNGDTSPDLLPRFQTIALSNASGVEWLALQAIAALPDTARSLATLRGIAKESGPVALFAVVELNKMGEPGVQILRQLDAEGSVTNPEARNQIREVLKR